MNVPPLSQYIDFCRKWQPFEQLRILLDEIPESKPPKGITVGSLTAEYAERAIIVVKHSIKFASEQAKFVISTDAPIEGLQTLKGTSCRYTDTEYCRQQQMLYQRILEHIAADVETLRTEEWLNSLERQPVVLLSWLELQVTILPSLKVNQFVEEPDKEFVRRVLQLVKRGVADLTLLLISSSWKR